MVESTRVIQDKQKLSAQDRLILIQTLNALPRTQFDELVFALEPPKGNIPDHPAPQGDRTTALLQWAESPIGPGLRQLEVILGSIIATHSGKAKQFMAIVIKGEISSSTTIEVQNFVDRLKKGDKNSGIEVEFFAKGCIKIILSGSSKEIEKLQELLETGELESVEVSLIEDIKRVENNTTDARKARLVQALKLRQPPIIHALINARTIWQDLWSHITHDLARDQYMSQMGILPRAIQKAIAYAYDGNSESYTYLELARDSAQDLARAIERERTRESSIVYYQGRELDLALYRDIALDLFQALDSALEMDRALDKVQENALNLKEGDLSGSNLRGIDLRDADLTGTNLTNADVTGTLFGNNQGLAETEKRDLQQRGAIFLDPPSSDVPSLVLR